MTEHNEQLDDLERRASDRLGRDLRALYEPPGSVRPQIDKAIREQIHSSFYRPPRLIIRLRWAVAATATAAVIALGVVVFSGRPPAQPQAVPPRIAREQISPGTPATSLRAEAEGRADIDSNGRVDILDAFRLAKHIESRGPTENRWDINGDGRVDRDDVDLVAFAAVRLNKGV